MTVPRTQALALSLSGGGFRGYYSALILKYIEQRLNRPCAEIFDVIAGTSVGGLIALGLANRIPAASIAAKMEGMGQHLFVKAPLLGISRFFRSPYRASVLRGLVHDVLDVHATSPLAESAVSVIVLAVSTARAELVAMRSWDRTIYGQVSTADAALATAAAPTYFPSVKVRCPALNTTLDLVDGGIVANSPDAVLLRYMKKELNFAEGEISMLSIGTCAELTGSIENDVPTEAGILGSLLWTGGKGIVDLILRVQEAHGISEARAILGDTRYLRIDNPAIGRQARLLRIDNASFGARETLKRLAQSTIETLNRDHNNPVLLKLSARAENR